MLKASKGIIGLVALTAGLSVAGAARGGGEVTLLNVSYDPTRELWRDMNANFAARYEKEKGVKVNVKQSHGGSSTQARSIIDGLEADVVSDTRSLWPAVDALLDAAGPGVRAMRDATRGGVATVLNELARASGLGITAASATAGWVSRRPSSSAGATCIPLYLMSSLTRSTT